MKMVPVKKESVNYKATKNLDLFREFQDCDAECVELVDHHYKSATVAVCVLNTSLKRYSIATIKAFSRNGHVYLVKL